MVQRKYKLSVELELVGNSTMRKLNKLYRGKDKPTDVLSFPASSFYSSVFLGSIVIDVATARLQAKEYAHSISREISELFIHGMLHLLGYDHEKPNEAAVMKRLELRFQRDISC